MLIDNEKFIGLLVENSGIEKEKVESYLEELINDIKSTFDEGDGYEVEGFGIFSKLGSNVLFIPSEELETEINYKYVGMEPIDLPGGASEKTEEKENPIQGVMDGDDTEESGEYEDPFAELLAEEELEPEEEAEEETVTTDDIAEELEEANTDETEDSLKDFIGDDEDLSTTSELEGEDEMPGPDKWGIDAHKEEDNEDAFSGLFGGTPKDKSELSEEETEKEDVIESEEEKIVEDEESVDFSALDDDVSEEEEDFDDPFKELEEKTDDAEEDFIPVVTKISSEKTAKEEKKTDDKVEETKDEKDKSVKKTKPTRDRSKSSPVFLYLILGLIIVAGAGYILAYFGVVNIQGITPTNKNTVVAQVPKQTVPNNSQSSPVTPEAKVPDNVTTEEPVQSENNAEDIAPKVADEKAPGDGGIITPVNVQAGAEVYGLKGTATEAGNNGYTIVLYTLSRKAGADAQFEKLSKNGYRVIIKERPSDTYGVLYRVSIGQFKSLADAAMAAETTDSSILGNYIITKI